MTYLDSEKSVRGGKPVELYKFVGTYETYYYSTGIRKVTFDDGSLDDDGNPNGPKDYLPIPVQRTEITAGTQDDDGLDITIQLPVSIQLVQDYAFQASPPSLVLTIYRFHNIGQFVPYWVGPVSGFKIQDGIAAVQSTSDLSYALSQDFPNVYFQGPCNLILYDVRCKIAIADWSGAANVTAISANGLTVTVDAMPHGATGTALDGQLVGGVFDNGKHESRMIVSQNANQIVVNFPFSNLHVGDAIELIAGCDHAYTGDCKVKFNNQLNFGGFPFIGSNNPFTDGLGGQTLPDNTCHYAGWRWRIIVQEGFTGGTLTPPDLSHGNASDFFIPTAWTQAYDDGEYWTYIIDTDEELAVDASFSFNTQRTGGSHPGAHQTELCDNGLNSVMRINVMHWTWSNYQLIIRGCSQTVFPQLWQGRLDGSPY